MTQYILISLVCLMGACLTLFSGFGLGTILVPVFSLFFPVELAVVLTAIVHFLNNLFKLALLGKQASMEVLIRFGIPSIPAALLGAWLLSALSDSSVLYTYMAFGKTCIITPLKLTIAALMLLFSLFEILPMLKKVSFDKKYLSIGGILSGFFGGLSGNQGALRSAFLLRAGLTKESFIATGVVIACFIDSSRLVIYFKNFRNQAGAIDFYLLAAATLFAFAGSFLGTRILKKVTIASVHTMVAVMLILFSILIGTGLL